MRSHSIFMSNLITEGNSYGLPIFCYDNITEKKADDRVFSNMEAFFEAFPSAEVTLIDATDNEVRVYC